MAGAGQQQQQHHQLQPVLDTDEALRLQQEVEQLRNKVRKYFYYCWTVGCATVVSARALP
jgi:hypothetical protein